MIYNVEVTADDFANAGKHNAMDCAFSRAIRRATGAEFVSVYIKRKDSLAPNPHYNVELHFRRPEMIGEDLKIKTPLENQSVSEKDRNLAQWQTSCYYKGKLPEHATGIIRAFDNDEDTPTLYIFPIDVPEAPKAA